VGTARGSDPTDAPLSRFQFVNGDWIACYNFCAMIDTALVPEKTVVNAKGDGPPVDLNGATGRVFLVTLDITRIVEQESLEVNIVGSPDGATWDPKPIASFPQRFYCGQYPLLLDLTEPSNVKFIRAHWEVGRWGRGSETPMFEFGVAIKEIPSDILREARAESKADLHSAPR
jgi:hypothetical protein